MTGLTAPMGCLWCGIPERGHGQRWTPEVSCHGYEQPTRDQIAERLRARLKPHATTKE